MIVFGNCKNIVGYWFLSNQYKINVLMVLKFEIVENLMVLKEK